LAASSDEHSLLSQGCLYTEQQYGQFIVESSLIDDSAMAPPLCGSPSASHTVLTPLINWTVVTSCDMNMKAWKIPLLLQIAMLLKSSPQEAAQSNRIWNKTEVFIHISLLCIL
jgi:hypothetical protein